MIRSRCAPLILVALVVVPACTSTPVVLDDDARGAARAELMEADRAWAAAAGTDDVERIVAFWTDDAIIARRVDMPQVVGIEAIREFIRWNREERPGFTISWAPTHAWVSADGRTGCTMGDGAMTVPDPSGRVITIRDRYCCMWRKEDGAWRCVLDLGIPGSGEGG